MFPEEDTFVVEYTVGNGYNCNCCRNENTSTTEFTDLDEAINFCIDTMVGKEVNGDDMKIEGIRKSSPEVDWYDIKREYGHIYGVRTEKLKADKLATASAEAAEKDSKVRDKELAELARLREKYEPSAGSEETDGGDSVT